MPPKRDKTTGLPLPSPVVPPTTTCAKLQIPDAPEYRQAFRGLLSDLGKFWNWQRTQGQSDEPARLAAELWRQALQTLVYDDECGGVMSCAEINDCIENNPTTRTTINNIVNQQLAPQLVVTPGQPLNEFQLNAPLNPLDGCDLDAFWAQCQQFVEYFTQAGTDAIEKFEVYTNAIEGAGFIEMAPLLGTLVDEVQIDQFLDFADWAIEIVGEAYAADLTQDVKDAIACAYFCAGKDDCQLTIERIWQVQSDRLGGLLIPSSIDSIEDLVSAMLTIASNPGLTVDIWLAFLAGAAKFAGYLGVRGIDQTLALTLKLAVNDANNDWEILCEDCAEPTEDRTPVISLPWDTVGGTLEGPDEDGYYIATTTAPASDWRIGISDVSGRLFKLQNLTYLSGVSSCQGWQREDTTVYVACTFTDRYNIEGQPPVYSILFTWASPASIRFQMIAP